MGLILGLESSCDETAAAVVEDGRFVRSNIIATQHDLHERYAGVVPEIASRAHLERITPVVREALSGAGCGYDDLDAIAVGHRPGLIGSLLVGVSAAKAIAWARGIPLLGIDHVLAHLYAPQLDQNPVPYPALGLVVSGGHTNIFHLTSPIETRRLGRTIDDAVGEAFDKVATILDLGYPGGPAVDHLARGGDDRAHEFPVANVRENRLDFSYSGLKTAVLYAVRGQPVGRGKDAHFERTAADLSPKQRADVAASFQRAAIRPLIRNLDRAIKTTGVTTVLVGGGVSANTRLRRELDQLATKHDLTLRLAPIVHCLDNAAMIAGLAWWRLQRGDRDDLTLSASPRSEIA